MARAESTPLNMVTAVLVTCVVAAASLTLTYELTRDRIIAQQRAAEERALGAVLPGAQEYQAMPEVVEAASDAAGDTTVDAVYRALGPEGEVLGWGVRTSPRGYSGPIQLIVGLDRTGKVLGVSIITMSETPGLGTKVATEEGWLDQFAGWDGNQIETDARAFDAIVGATRSSAAVRDGVVAAGRAYVEVLQETEEVGAQ